MSNINNTGLVLEGGGFRAIFVAAALEVFHKHELFFPYMIGVSAGAAYGVSYVTRQLGRNLATNKFINDKRYCGIKHLIKNGDYFNWEFIYKVIPTSLLFLDYEALKTSSSKFQVVLTNCETARPEYFDANDSSPESLCDILSATSSLPFISKIRVINGNRYLDGGLTNAIPIDQAFSQNNSHLVVILTRPKGYEKRVSKRNGLFKLFYRKYPHLIDVISNRIEKYNARLREIENLESEGKIYVIRPENQIPIGRLQNDPQALEKVYFDSMKQIEKDIPRLKDWLKTTN
jgi:Predicted esterase of the alpha-beta hydrolase superfamily